MKTTNGEEERRKVKSKKQTNRELNVCLKGRKRTLSPK